MQLPAERGWQRLPLRTRNSRREHARSPHSPCARSAVSLTGLTGRAGGPAAPARGSSAVALKLGLAQLLVNGSWATWVQQGHLLGKAS